MKVLVKIPELKKATFDKWAEEIITNYEIKTVTPLDVLTKDIADFFNKLFKNYEVSSYGTRPDGIFPFSVNRTDRKPGYADEAFYEELFIVENHLRWTYTSILTKLFRDKECPFDSVECPY